MRSQGCLKLDDLDHILVDYIAATIHPIPLIVMMGTISKNALSIRVCDLFLVTLEDSTGHPVPDPCEYGEDAQETRKLEKG